MSTTKTFTNIKAGKRHQIDATARGYYDFRTTVVPQPNKSLSFDMRVYDGLNYAVDLSKNSVRPGEINFDGTVLPYVENNTLTKTNYCFGNSGTNYDLPVYNKEYVNINKIGDFDIGDGIVSNFYRDHYLTVTLPNYSSGSVNSFEICMKVHTPTNNTSNARILNSTDSYDNLALDLGTAPGFNFCGGTIGFGSQFDADIDLWVKVQFDGTNLSLHHSLNGVDYIQDNSKSWSKSNVWFTSNTYSLGLRSYDFVNVCFFNGTIDLNECYVKINDEIINFGENTLQKQYTGYTLEGNASINGSICSGFDSNSRLYVENWNLDISKDNIFIFTTGNSVTENQVLLMVDETNDALQFFIGNSKLEYNSGSISEYTTENLEPNTLYKVKIHRQDEHTYIFSLSKNDGAFSDEKTITSNLFSDTYTNRITVGNYRSHSSPFQGTIDLSEMYNLLSIVTESKPGIFQDYEDNGQSNTLNCFSNSNRYTVLSPNENIIYYMKHQYIDWTQPILSSDGTMGGDLFAVNSSSILRAGREAYKAFDGDTSTIDDNWHSSQGHPSWIGWYNPNPLKITRIQVQNRNSADGGSFVNTYKLSYSDDYSDWVDLLSGTSPSQENFTYWNIDITEENPHKYWRLTCLTSSGSNSDYTSIQTISITAQEYVSLKGTPDDYDEIVKYTYLGTVDIPKHNIYNVDNFYGWSNDSKSIFTKTLQLSTDIPLYNSSYKQESAITISSFADNSITLSNNEVYTRNNTLDKHVVLSTSASGGEVNPPNPDIPTTLKFGDRIDNKATVVGTFESSDLGTVVVAVLDSTYYGQHNWASGLNVTDTGLPNYATEDEALAAKESATYNTDYILNNYSNKATEAFTYCRSIEPLNFNGKKYNCQLPNAYELKQIYNNSEKLYELDPTTSTNTSYNLANWDFNGLYDIWSSNECTSDSSWEIQPVGALDNYSKDGPFGVIPIIEIPLSK